jgi:hypothetical protein
MTGTAIEVAQRWFRSQGYPLEYETARELAKIGLQVRQGVGYLDQDSDIDKAREIDIVAEAPPAALAKIRVVVECKRASSPWVVFLPSEQERPAAPPYDVTTAATRSGRGLLETLRKQGPPFPNIFVGPDRVGFSVREANPERRPDATDPAVATLHQVTKAAIGSFQEFGRGERPAIAFPVIVMDGPLFQVAVDAEGADDIQPVLWQRVLWHGSTVKREPTAIDVVTREHLPIYAFNLMNGLGELSKRLTPIARAVWGEGES